MTSRGGKGDTRQATWSRIVRKLRTEARLLREFGFTVIEPAELDVHPDFRSSST